MNINRAEVGHLTGWSNWDWILNTVLIFGWVLGTVAVLVAAFGVFAIGADIVEKLPWPPMLVVTVSVIAVLIAGIATLLGAYFTFASYVLQVFDVLRHSTSWARSLLMTVFVIGVLIAVVAIGQRRITEYGDVDWRVVVAVPGPWIVFAVGAFFWDGVHRVAAWVPTTLGGLGAMVVVGLAVAFGMSQKDSAR